MEEETVLSVNTVGYCRFTVDSGRQIPTLAWTDDGISCSPPRVYVVSCRNSVSILTCLLSSRSQVRFLPGTLG